MWAAENRPRNDRCKLRNPSDLTDEERSVIAPLDPATKKGGNKRTVDVRAVINGVMNTPAPAASGLHYPRICRRVAR
jgi:hypothetical protein